MSEQVNFNIGNSYSNICNMSEQVNFNIGTLFYNFRQIL